MTADRQLFALVSILIGIGILLSYTLSTYVIIRFETNEYHFVIRQLAFGMMGILIIWGLSLLNPDKWLKPIGFFLFFTSAGLMIAMPFLPESLVPEIGGAKRWIKILGFSLAPVEFFKIGFVYFLAFSFNRKFDARGDIGILKEFKRFMPYAVVFAGAAFMIAFVQKDLGQTVVLSGALIVMLMFAGSSFRFFLILLGVFITMLGIAIYFVGHRVDRIMSWWSLAQNTILEFFPAFLADKLRVPAEVEPYQISHSLNAIYNGGYFGVGLGAGTFKLGFLSEVHTDFILAGLAEEFGFFGVAVVVFIFLWMLQRIFKVANRTKDRTIYLFSIGIGLVLAFAFLINAYGISGLIPIKGISIPFLSYGGSVMLGSCMGIGMVLMASKKAVNYKGLE
jgi:cell division protein FtsW